MISPNEAIGLCCIILRAPMTPDLQWLVSGTLRTVYEQNIRTTPYTHPESFYARNYNHIATLHQKLVDLKLIDP